MSTLTTERLRHALEGVRNATDADYGAELEDLAKRIRTAGLGQAIAWLRNRQRAPGLCADLANWLEVSKARPAAPNLGGKPWVDTHTVTMELLDYLDGRPPARRVADVWAAQAEVMAWLAIAVPLRRARGDGSNASALRPKVHPKAATGLRRDTILALAGVPIDESQGLERHPGLQLDKFVGVGFPQEVQGQEIDLVCKATGGRDLLGSLRSRRESILRALDATTFEAVSVEPLALHLSRPGVLENAGLCLHPLYGFAYLPGQGLKGVARAYAETVWRPAQASPEVARATVDRVFGPGPEEDGSSDSASTGPAVAVEATGIEETASAVGTVVFHEAWPTAWPTLERDIVNSHHSEYYRSEGTVPPTDSEEPNLVSFIAVRTNCAFGFAVSARGGRSCDEDVAQAIEWLRGGLAVLGVGAKTAAGYGHFDVSMSEGHASPALLGIRDRETKEFTLQLVTPAFLAGARQNETDCDLRAPTMRGLLRWWWRTMHVGFVNTKELRALEDEVWGSASRSGAVAVRVRRVPQPSLKIPQFDRQSLMTVQGLRTRLATMEPRSKRTQGLKFASYGLNDPKKPHGPLVVRHFRTPGEQWVVTLSARHTTAGATTILEQAWWALWLLCRFGGVGAKTRHGFGSLQDVGGLNNVPGEGGIPDDLWASGERLRSSTGLAGRGFEVRKVLSPSLKYAVDQHLLFTFNLTGIAGTDTAASWKALDLLGSAAQESAASRRHHDSKLMLGAPRMGLHLPGVPDRYASPVIYHLVKPQAAADPWRVRVSVFPALTNPSLERQREYLKVIVGEVGRYLASPPAIARV